MLLFARTIRLLRRSLRRNAESETWRHWNWVLDHKNLPHLLPAINVDTLHGWSKASKEVRLSPQPRYAHPRDSNKITEEVQRCHQRKHDPAKENRSPKEENKEEGSLEIRKSRR